MPIGPLRAILTPMDYSDPLADVGTAPATGELTPADLAALGATVTEIAAELGISPREASERMGAPTPAQLRRIEHMHIARAVGIGDSLPHVQAQQSVLSAYMPETYGRQAAAGGGTLRIVVDRTYELRKASAVHEGEVVLSLPSPQG